MSETASSGVYAVSSDSPSLRTSDRCVLFRSCCITVLLFYLFLRIRVVLGVDLRHLRGVWISRKLRLQLNPELSTIALKV